MLAIARPLQKMPWQPRVSLLDRYILGEMIRPFIFGFGIFTAIAAVIGTVFYLIRNMVEHNLGILSAIQVFFLRLPTFAVLGIPMAMLFGSLLAYSQLSRRSELIACKSCGVSAVRLVRPALLAGFCALLFTFALNELVAPPMAYRAIKTLEVAIQRPQPTFQTRNIFYRRFASGQLQQLFFAHRFDGEVMGQVTVLNFEQGQLREIITAQEAQWHGSAWLFRQGTYHHLTGDREYDAAETFAERRFPYPRTPLDLAMETRAPEFMTSREIYHYLQVLAESGDTKRLRQWRVQLQEKLSLPFLCLSFAVVGAVLGISSPRQGQGRAFGLSVAIIFGYYVGAFIFTAFGEGGAVSPIVASWLPKMIVSAIALGMLYHANRH
ncbi:LptF/LptG family permease [Thermosynechococcus sichuanensis E542]|uniref:LptF/LptG family permease n=1 Tax=Thermosynechococcus sichuanensis E542 TaxID=2016101 RepID=A0A7D6ERT6_9CYAN|nr:LptF/LptG family permease [Thermosynechococcus vestitus]QLL29347.1 LptF/LptG family permease [Thermosynechococcus vestitus E542]